MKFVTLLCSTEWKAKVGSISISRGACRNGAKRQSYFATFSLFANSGSPQQLLHPIPPPSQHEEKKQPTSQHEKATQPAHEKERKIPPHGFICHVSYLLHSTLYVMYHPPWEGRNIWTLFTHFFWQLWICIWKLFESLKYFFSTNSPENERYKF